MKGIGLLEILIIYVLRLILIFTLILEIVKILRYHRQIGEIKILIIIAIASLAQMTLVNLFVPKIFTREFADYLINMYIVIETMTFTFFFSHFFLTHRFRNIARWILRFEITTILILLIISPAFLLTNSFYESIASLEGITMIIFCLISFYEIIFDSETTSLFQSPKFLITSGIFILFCTTFPLFLVKYIISLLSEKYHTPMEMITSALYILYNYSILKSISAP